MKWVVEWVLLSKNAREKDVKQQFDNHGVSFLEIKMVSAWMICFET